MGRSELAYNAFEIAFLGFVFLLLFQILALDLAPSILVFALFFGVRYMMITYKIMEAHGAKEI